MYSRVHKCFAVNVFLRKQTVACYNYTYPFLCP